ncbi:ATP-binding cassette domain-containing protein [Lachnospira multipara]|uniref:ABC-2 type transport system ATP-binding protein n=1 Tax=Lachnospira multipara TaxID=28051 RepID=A0A1H5UEU5_9FIRM|nr:ABC transporter ATP-binding protein [Lachnospira multipara]SEF73593.1 ABC-2 type transport system ATP-binding protein [Lachnospira multipara]
MIELKSVSKKFDHFQALDKIGSSISDSSIYGMVGSNGAGKSTLLRILAGIYEVDEGEVLYDGQAIYNNPEVKKNVVLVGDELYFFPGADLKRMAKFYASVYDNFDKDLFNELIIDFKLDIGKNLGHYSKGMRRQAAIVLALSTGANYLLFDETFDGLDPVVRKFVKKKICEIVADKKATVIITSHSLRELEDICDHLVLLHKGSLVVDSDIIELKTHKFKVQIAFREEFNRDKFSDFDIVSYSQRGSVANIIINGEKEIVVNRLKGLNPVLLDVLPLTLEEIFIYEMEKLGYDFLEVAYE